MSTPYMNLDLPSPLVTLGPTWATLLNAAFGDVDAHDHTAGNGLPIRPAAMLFDEAVNLNGQPIQNLQSIALQSLAAAATGTSTIYSLNGDLYFRNGNDVPIAITVGNAIAGAPGSITNLPAGNAVYEAPYEWIRFFFDASSMAGLDIGFLTMRQNKSRTGPTFSLVMPTTGMAANIAWQMPVDLPTAPENYGVVAARIVAANRAALEYQVFDNATIESVVVGSKRTIRLKDQGISTTKILYGAVTGGISGTTSTGSLAYRTIVTENIAETAITTAKIANANVTTAKIALGAVTGGVDGLGAATGQLAALTVAAGNIALGAVRGGVDGGGLATQQLAARTIVGGNIALLGVTAAELGNNAVETAKILDSAVTPIKRPLLLGYGEYADVTVPINMPSATWYAPTVTDVQGVNLTGGRPFTISLQGNSSGAPESEFTLQNRSVVNVDATFVLDVYVYSRANAVVLRGWRSRFTVRAGGGFQSFPSLTWQDTASNSRNDCIVVMRIKGSGTDIWLHRLENFYWTLWQ